MQSILKKVKSEPTDKEVIIVDDGSTDGTRELLEREVGGEKVFYHEKNKGKGAAIRTGLHHANGEFVLIQDADLEYDPADYADLLEEIRKEGVDVVYGSRFLKPESNKFYSKTQYLANKFLTFLSNLLTGLDITDMETCYKLFRRRDLAEMDFKESSFGIEPEITAKVARRGLAVSEVPISYEARGRGRGKEINWKDGLWAIWCIFKYNIFD